jgi:hypothetical protein
MRLTAEPTPINTLDLANDQRVTVVRDVTVFVFVCFEPSTLKVRWTQRAPGDVTDPRGDRDYKDRDGLWRSFLDDDFRDLVDRFDPATLVEVAQEYA